MGFFASCGHEVKDDDELVPAEFDDSDYDWDSGFLVPTVISGVYCRKCFAKGERDGWMRRSALIQT